MNLFKGKYRAESTRLKEWDYSWDGYYFVTICVKMHRCYLGNVTRGVMKLSELGRIVKKCWENLSLHYWNCRLDEYVIMPNHVHGIIVIDNHGSHCVETVIDNHGSHCVVETGFKPVSAKMAKCYSLSEMIRGFKTFSAKEINAFCNTRGQPFWQPRFYDHVIRNDQDLERLRNYIKNNPLKWGILHNKKQTL